MTYETAREVCADVSTCPCAADTPLAPAWASIGLWVLLQYMEQKFKERGYCTNGDVSHVVMSSHSLLYMASK